MRVSYRSRSTICSTTSAMSAPMMPGARPIGLGKRHELRRGLAQPGQRLANLRVRRQRAHAIDDLARRLLADPPAGAIGDHVQRRPLRGGEVGVVAGQPPTNESWSICAITWVMTSSSRHNEFCRSTPAGPAGPMIGSPGDSGKSRSTPGPSSGGHLGASVLIASGSLPGFGCCASIGSEATARDAITHELITEERSPCGREWRRTPLAGSRMAPAGRTMEQMRLPDDWIAPGGGARSWR
jgi:hypothetical protein